MDDQFINYLGRLESMAFFSGYPLLYAFLFLIAGNFKSASKRKYPLFPLLPFAYALVGTLYLALQLRNLYPDYSLFNIKQSIGQPYLTIWGISAMIFWIPSLAGKPILSLLHSFVFFYFLVKDILTQLFVVSADKHILRNEMKLFTDSLLLNIVAMVAIILLNLILIRLKRLKKS